MPKMKTNKAVASRFRVTGTGKLKRSRPGKRHILTKKTGKKKRQLRQPAIVDKAHTKTYTMMMGVA